MDDLLTGAMLYVACWSLGITLIAVCVSIVERIYPEDTDNKNTLERGMRNV